ncbi:hypothetical protein JX266_002376 [Neoarthrinium moseri]|nr:hypothetical protein JX266_002376 [Neoarthrinium moseri]
MSSPVGRPPSPPTLVVPYDGHYYDEGSMEYKAWRQSALRPSVIAELERFVANRITGRGRAKHVHTAEGSYNIVFQFQFSARSDVALRIPKLGHTPAAIVAKKVLNEVAWMKFLKARTRIPIPCVHDHSKRADDHVPLLKLPFILMDCIQGQNLRTFLRLLGKPGEDAANDSKRTTIYEQIATFYLQLHRLPLEAIGSI